MPYKLKLQNEAVLDMQQAFEWYEEQRPGLGTSFLDEVETCFQKLIQSPELFGYINKWLRRMKVNGFPYVVIYEIENDLIFVTSVFHTSKAPKH